MPESVSTGWTSGERAHAAVVEREFRITSPSNGEPVAGVYRTPQEATADRLVLLGHGGRTDKRVEYLAQVAHLLAARGIATMAIDGPGHGERARFEFTEDPDEFVRAWRDGGDTDGMLGDWRTALDFVEAEFGARPTGWWGLSMGTMMGLPVCATEPRIQVAVLGLMGTWGPNGSDLRRMAPDVTCPLRFLVQWDDEVVPRDHCLELFGLLGSQKKTLHANPGAHSAVPVFEFAGTADYLDRFLG